MESSSGIGEIGEIESDQMGFTADGIKLKRCPFSESQYTVNGRIEINDYNMLLQAIQTFGGHFKKVRLSCDPFSDLHLNHIETIARHINEYCDKNGGIGNWQMREAFPNAMNISIDGELLKPTANTLEMQQLFPAISEFTW